MAPLTIFILLSAALVYISRNDLRNRHSYGYYRFFAFEFTLLLVVANLRVWFEYPLSPSQILSWISLLGSLYLAVSGFRSLGLTRAADRENSHELIETGIYGKIRHPMYSSLLFLAFGAFMKQPALYSSILMFGAVYTLIATVRAEEEVDEKKFGEHYVEYRLRTKMFIPFIF